MRSRNRFAVTFRKIATKELKRFSKSGNRNFMASSPPGSSPATIMDSGHETIQLRLENRTAWITLDRPPLNILDIPMTQALDTALEQVLPNCDFVIFQGAGPKGFSAGAEIADHAPERVEKMLSAFHAVFRRLAAAGWNSRLSVISLLPRNPRSLASRKSSSAAFLPLRWLPCPSSSGCARPQI